MQMPKLTETGRLHLIRIGPHLNLKRVRDRIRIQYDDTNWPSVNGHRKRSNKQRSNALLVRQRLASIAWSRADYVGDRTRARCKVIVIRKIPNERSHLAIEIM